ncbi:MAG TPA: acyltransferase family protein [Tepidisphaeraceae bacterium]|nr:acyltransferase family protein [Tepidisphaeraceae bacterium]
MLGLSNSNTLTTAQTTFRSKLQEPVHVSVSPPLQHNRQLAYVDAVRIIGALAVVLGHICSEVIFDWKTDHAALPVSNGAWWYALTIDSLSRFAVPVFVMLSGAMLLKPNSRQSTGEFYKRRMTRIGVPALFWSAVFFVLVAKNPTYGISDALMKLAAGEPAAHLHFVFRIAGLYLFTPFLRIALGAMTRRQAIQVTIACFALAIVDALLKPILRTHDTGTEVWAGHSSLVANFVPFIGYYLAGYLLSDVQLSKRRQFFALLGVLIGGLTVAAGTGFMRNIFGAITTDDPRSVFFFDLLNPARVLVALCAFSLFRSWFSGSWPDKPVYKFISNVTATLGVYLVHPLMMGVLYKFNLDARSLGVWIGVPITFVMVALMSFGFSIVVSKIPVMKWIVGCGNDRKC